MKKVVGMNEVPDWVEGADNLAKYVAFYNGRRLDSEGKLQISMDIPCPIWCREHGLFWSRPDHHLQGEGCPDCEAEDAEL